MLQRGRPPVSCRRGRADRTLDEAPKWRCRRLSRCDSVARRGAAGRFIRRQLDTPQRHTGNREVRHAFASSIPRCDIHRGWHGVRCGNGHGGREARQRAEPRGFHVDPAQRRNELRRGPGGQSPKRRGGVAGRRPGCFLVHPDPRRQHHQRRRPTPDRRGRHAHRQLHHRDR